MNASLNQPVALSMLIIHWLTVCACVWPCVCVCVSLWCVYVQLDGKSPAPEKRLQEEHCESVPLGVHAAEPAT